MISQFRQWAYISTFSVILISITSCKTEQQALLTPDFPAYTDSLIAIQPFSDKTIDELLEKHHVNGVSITYIDYDKGGWTKGYGYTDKSKKQKIDKKTQFQLGSLSKLFATYSFMRILEREKISLDNDLREYLERYNIENDYPETILTLRNLLRHKGGINYYKLQGYKKGEPIPTLEQIIQGESPAKNKELKVENQPYKTSQYSEGGYVILERLINDLIGGRGVADPYVELVQFGLLDVLEMYNTTMIYPKDTTNIALGYDANGNKLEGGYYIYPETAAGGIWSTSSDLSRLIYEMGTYRNRRSKIMEHDWAEMYVKEGLGVDYFYRTHAFGAFGRNDGYSNQVKFSIKTLNGMVIMTNSEDGGALINDINLLLQKQFEKSPASRFKH